MTEITMNDLLSQEAKRNPHTFYSQLRSTEPLVYVEGMNDTIGEPLTWLARSRGAKAAKRGCASLPSFFLSQQNNLNLLPQVPILLKWVPLLTHDWLLCIIAFISYYI